MNDIKKKYIQLFFNKLTDEEKRKIYFNQYMWHAFSYEKIDCIEKEDAIKEFKKRENNKVYIINQNDDSVLEYDNLTYDRLLELMYFEVVDCDCYVVDKDFKWTFVFTHEAIQVDNNQVFYYIGPFFKSLD